MNNLSNFKSELRLVQTSGCDDALEAWFECAAQMFIRGMRIPFVWEYKPRSNNPTEIDSYFHEFFKESSDEELIEIGNFLFRYLRLYRNEISED